MPIWTRSCYNDNDNTRAYLCVYACMLVLGQTTFSIGINQLLSLLRLVRRMSISNLMRCDNSGQSIVIRINLVMLCNSLTNALLVSNIGNCYRNRYCYRISINNYDTLLFLNSLQISLALFTKQCRIVKEGDVLQIVNQYICIYIYIWGKSRSEVREFRKHLHKITVY